MQGVATEGLVLVLVATGSNIRNYSCSTVETEATPPFAIHNSLWDGKARKSVIKGLVFNEDVSLV